MKLNKNFRILSILLSTAVMPIHMGYCMEEVITVNSIHKNQTLTSMVKSTEEMPEGIQKECDQFLQSIFKGKYDYMGRDYAASSNLLFPLAEKNPVLARSLIEKLTHWAKTKLGFHPEFLLVEFADVDEKKISFLMEQLTPFVENDSFGASSCMSFISACKNIDEKKVSHICKELPPFIKRCYHSTAGLKELIEVCKDIDNEIISLLFKAILPNIKMRGGKIRSAYDVAKAFSPFKGIDSQILPYIEEKLSEVKFYYSGLLGSGEDISVFKGMDERKISFYFEKIKSWVKKSNRRVDDYLGLIKTFSYMDEEKLSFFIENMMPWGRNIQEETLIKTFEDIKDLEFLKALLEKAMKERKVDDYGYFSIDKLRYHAEEDKEKALNLWVSSPENSFDLTDVIILAFIPRDKWKDYQQKRIENSMGGGVNDERLLNYYQTITSTETSFYFHWKNLLQSSNAEVASWCATFIINKRGKLNLDEGEDDGLFQWALQNQIKTSSKEVYKIHGKLLEKRKDFDVEKLKPFVQEVSDYPIALNPIFFQKMTEFLKFDPKMVSQVSEPDFKKLFDSLAEKKLEIEKLVGQSLESFSSNLKMSYLFNLLKAPEENMIAAQWKCLVNHMLSLSKESKEEGLSDQQEALILNLFSIGNCDTGKEDGIIQSYNLLPMSSRLRGVEFTTDMKLWIMETLSQKINSVIDNGIFLHSLLNCREKSKVSQESHCIKYLKGLIANYIGLPWQNRFDPYGNMVSKALLELKAQDVVQRHYDEAFTPEIVVNHLRQAINQRLEQEKDPIVFANSISYLASKYSVRDMWEIEQRKNGEGWNYHYKGITEKGVVLLLKAMGATMNVDR